MYSAEQIKPVAPSSRKWYLTALLLWAVLCLVQERGNRSKMAEEEKAETVCPSVSEAETRVRPGLSADRRHVLQEASRNPEAAVAILSPAVQYPRCSGPLPGPAELPVPLLLGRRPSAARPSAAARPR